MELTKSPARPSLNRSLEGQRVVIIGGTSGFEMATGKAASAEGASVIVASSKKVNVDRALAQLQVGAEGHVLDITQESAVTDFFSAIGEFDHLAVTGAKYAAKRIKATGSIILTNGGGQKHQLRHFRQNSTCTKHRVLINRADGPQNRRSIP